MDIRDATPLMGVDLPTLRRYSCLVWPNFYACFIFTRW